MNEEMKKQNFLPKLKKSSEQKMLPNITNKSSSLNKTHQSFLVKLDLILDLFHDEKIDQINELKNIQTVLNDNNNKLNILYGIGNMNRKAFQKFAYHSLGLSAKPADEIFSCATNLYAWQDDETTSGEDCYMTTAQFAAGIVRLANLSSMMKNGVVNTRLSCQTENFLSSIVT
jgi:hypothetical protein